MRSIAFSLLVCALVASRGEAASEYRARGADIFDPKVSGEKLVADALSLAKRDDKRILLLFGANWCPWCRQLHRALSDDAAVRAQVNQKFILVYIDANTRNDRVRNAAVIAKYGNPIQQHGLPVFVVLDREGNHLTTRETASLAATTEAEVAVRVLRFLKEWAK